MPEVGNNHYYRRGDIKYYTEHNYFMPNNIYVAPIVVRKYRQLLTADQDSVIITANY
jgi:hypothetical protein